MTALDDQTNPLSTRKIITVFLGVASISLFALMDETSVAVALPAIGSDLNAQNGIVWVATARFITSTAFQLIYGRFADIWSRKAVLLSAIVIFFFGSLGASLAQNLIGLTLARAICGIGGGGLLTVAQVVIADVVSLRERGKYQGILGAAVALGNGIGPVVGGLFSDKASWRWIFRLNLILSFLSFITVFWIIPAKPPGGSWKTKIGNVDYFGSFMVLSSSTLIVLSLTWGGAQYKWISVQVVLSLILGLCCLVLFILWQWKGAKLPSLPLHVFTYSVVWGACITHAINGWCAITQSYYLPTLYQMLYAYSATKSGALLLPVIAVGTVASTASGLLITWKGRYREIVLSGWIMWSIGLGLLATLHTSSGLDKQIGYSLLTGLGLGQTFQPALVAVQAAVDRKDVAVTTGARNFSRALGGTIGLAVSGSILNNALRSQLRGLPASLVDQIISDPLSALNNLDPESLSQLQAAYQKGFRTIFLVCSGMAAAAFLFALFLMKQVDLDQKDEDRYKTPAAAPDTATKGEKGSNESCA